MNTKNLLLLSGVLLLLAACAANNVDTAVEYLEALNARDLDRARALVCEEQEDDVTMGLTTVDDPQVEPFTFSNVSCAARGADVSCRFTIEQFTQSEQTTGVTQTRQVVFRFQDGKVCGFEEEVAE